MGHLVFMKKIKNICILGSTGSIGKSSLEVISNFPDQFRVTYLAANKNIDLLYQQVKKFKPSAVALQDENAAFHFRKMINGRIKIFSGKHSLSELVNLRNIDIVINSLVGFTGLRPTIEAIKNGKTIALANKESLVVAGEIIMKLAKKFHTKLIPIDSEHSAILQCLIGENTENISKIIITASGGPFLHLEKNKFSKVTVRAALNHPNWRMGKKITIDSATLMNKGLELIEAHWLFGLPQKKIEILVHPQSIIHSMVEFIDGSIKAQLGVHDMKIPIQYALTYPERAGSEYKRVNFPTIREMTFFEPDLKKFECLQLAYDALEQGGTAPTILNAANEVAVNWFLQSKISFDRIPKLIQQALEKVPIKVSPELDDIIQTDKDTRRFLRDGNRFIK